MPLKLFYVTIFVVALSTSLFGQEQKRLDSLKKELNVLVYSNPKLAIAQGLELYEASHDDPSYQVSVLLAIANGYAVLKEHDNVFRYALKADSIAEVNAFYIDQVRVLGFIGGQYRRLKLSNRALQYLDQAYDLTLEHPLPDSLEFLKGNILVVKGLVQKDNIGCEFALPYLKEGVEVFKKNSIKNAIKANLAITLNNIGECHIEIENYTAAKTSFNEAIMYAEEINAIKSVASSKLGLARLLTLEGQHDAAVKILENALTSIEGVNDAATNSLILKALSENYEILGNEEKHNSYTRLYLAEEHKLLEEEKKSLNKVTEELSSENQEKRQNQKTKYTFIFIVFGFFLILILVVF